MKSEPGLQMMVGNGAKAEGALGGFIGGPLGAKIGSGLASAAGKAIGLEGEMEGGELEFEGARQFVRLAADTARNAVAAAQSGVDPRSAAQSAAVSAARRLAPALLTGSSASMPVSGTVAGMVPGQSGRWSRHGRRIVLHGV
jgi:hypothetical protein